MKKNKNKNNNLQKYFGLGLLFSALAVLAFYSQSFSRTVVVENIHEAEDAKKDNGVEIALVDHSDINLNIKPDQFKVKHIKTPDSVKAIYMSACVASTKNFRDDLVRLIEETELNSIIIDIKDYSGTISFKSGLAGDGGSGCRSNDLKEFIADLHDRNIYVIGRISVFQDSFYGNLHPEFLVKKKSDKTPWVDHKGLNFIDVNAKDFWDYILELSYISHQIGFDEINYDYIRFPSDGKMSDIYYPFSQKYIDEDEIGGRVTALEKFFVYLNDEITKYNQNQEYPIITSADLFGMVTTANNDLKIGQILESALPYFDYIAPMVYPSHYPPGFNGWADPNKVPYDLINYVMSSAVDKVNDFKNATTTPDLVRERVGVEQLRPWLQDFNYGGNYGPAEVRAQIEATYDVGLTSWMLWAPSNRYTRKALKDN